MAAVVSSVRVVLHMATDCLFGSIQKWLTGSGAALVAVDGGFELAGARFGDEGVADGVWKFGGQGRSNVSEGQLELGGVATDFLHLGFL